MKYKIKKIVKKTTKERFIHKFNDFPKKLFKDVFKIDQPKGDETPAECCNSLFMFFILLSLEYCAITSL